VRFAVRTVRSGKGLLAPLPHPAGRGACGEPPVGVARAAGAALRRRRHLRPPGIIGPPLPAWFWSVLLLVVVVYAIAEDGHGPSLQRLAEESRRRSLEGRQHAAAARVRRRCPETAEVLGWDRTPEGSRRCARPSSATSRRCPGAFGSPSASRRPAAADVADLVDAPRRHLGAYSADHGEHPHSPGTIVASFGTHPLPGRVDAPALRWVP
jgi:hypothetical protein